MRKKYIIFCEVKFIGICKEYFIGSEKGLMNYVNRLMKCKYLMFIYFAKEKNNLIKFKPAETVTKLVIDK